MADIYRQREIKASAKMHYSCYIKPKVT